MFVSALGRRPASDDSQSTRGGSDLGDNPADGPTAMGLAERLIQPLLATGFIADAAPRPSDFDLHQWLEDLPGRREGRRETAGISPVIGIMMLEIEARLRRIAQGLSHASPSETGKHSDKWKRG